MSLAVGQNRQPNLENVHRNLESIWYSLAVRAGLVEAVRNCGYPSPRPDMILSF